MGPGRPGPARRSVPAKTSCIRALGVRSDRRPGRQEQQHSGRPKKDREHPSRPSTVLLSPSGPICRPCHSPCRNESGMLPAIDPSAETFFFRRGHFIDHHRGICFLKDGIEGGFIHIQVSPFHSSGHIHSVYAKDNMKGINKIMGMLCIRKYPPCIRIQYLDIGMITAVVDLYAPVVLRKAPFISREEDIRGPPGRVSRQRAASLPPGWNNRHSMPSWCGTLKPHRLGPVMLVSNVKLSAIQDRIALAASFMIPAVAGYLVDQSPDPGIVRLPVLFRCRN